ncbi:hypothetical protein LTR17_004565 [Elasticomyces elasticus]|nr:hypothetical protein LTR17_004565 [Elasticomyces elasticus]
MKDRQFKALCDIASHLDTLGAWPPEYTNYRWRQRPAAYDDSAPRASISFALRQLYANPDVDHATNDGHNLVGGLAQFLAQFHTDDAWSFNSNYGTALQYITDRMRMREIHQNHGPSMFSRMNATSARYQAEERMLKELQDPQMSEEDKTLEREEIAVNRAYDE